MKNLKYLAYAVPCCMAIFGEPEVAVLGGMIALVLAVLLD